MTPKIYVDGLLVEWGHRFFEAGEFAGPPGVGKRVRRVSGGGGSVGSRRRPASSAGGGGGRLDARAVRGRLQDLVSKAPQVLVKVYGGGRGMKHIRVHLRYIARDGAVPLEDQDGIRRAGDEQVRELAEEWQAAAVAIPEISNRREAVNIVLSMPEGTDPLAVKKAVRDFAAREFGNHQYAMALHTIDTPHYVDDKEDPPSRNPHVHLLVKSRGFDGEYLNVRKADLHRWRQGLAEALREHGIEAVATSRAHRLDRARGDRRGVREMKDRQKPFTKVRRGRASPEKVEKAQRTERVILKRYEEVAQVLVDSEDPSDRALALSLAQRFGLQRPTPSPPERGGDRQHRRPDLDLPPPRGKTGTDDRER